MYSNDFRELVKRKYNDQGSYRAVARIENVWHLLSSLVYDGPQFLSKDDLWLRIQTCADKINADHQVTLQTLRDSMPRCLLSVIANKVINY